MAGSGAPSPIQDRRIRIETSFAWIVTDATQAAAAYISFRSPLDHQFATDRWRHMHVTFDSVPEIVRAPWSPSSLAGVSRRLLWM